MQERTTSFSLFDLSADLAGLQVWPALFPSVSLAHEKIEETGWSDEK
jgi:hypothetical protein